MIAEERRIKTKIQLKECLKYERQKYKLSHPTIGRLFPVTESDILFNYQVVLRKSEYYHNSGKRIMGKIYSYKLIKLQNKYSIHIPINCFDVGLKIMHVGPILVNSKSCIGRDCSLHINTAIVAGGTNNGAPVLGDGIVVGIGAVVLGSVNIPNNVAIGANAVVNKSFIENSISIAGVPAKKISDNGASEWNK